MQDQPNLTKFFSSLGFMGAGNMAGAIVKAVVRSGALPPEACSVHDVLADKAQALADDLGIQAASTPGQLMASCSNVVLATKPQDFGSLLASLAPLVTPEHLIISIAAGVPARSIEAGLGSSVRVVRVMPNTPALAGQGAAGVAAGAHATPEDVRAVCALFESVGIAAQVDEKDLDAVTALSGSGPAYVFKFIEVLAEAGVEMGLDPELAARFALQTFVGASRLAAESDESPAELRRRVTSKGGTTAAALASFDESKLAETIKRGVKRARERSRELADQA